jgi:hypothetical protein
MQFKDIVKEIMPEFTNNKKMEDNGLVDFEVK